MRRKETLQRRSKGLKHLMVLNYFSKTTEISDYGTSFQTAGRQFALIDKSLESLIIYPPDDLISIIESECPNRPFKVQSMNRNDFINFAILRPSLISELIQGHSMHGNAVQFKILWLTIM